MIKLLLGLLFISGLASADPDYRLITPPLTQGDRVEVTEYFYYGCEQCFAFEPFFAAWQQRHPEVRISRIPAVRSAWLPLAKAYYSLAAMNIESDLRGRIYAAMQNDDLNDERVLFSWLAKQGVDLQRFTQLYDSSQVARQIVAANDAARSCGIVGTPSLVVDGRFLVLGNLARAELLDRLVEMAKTARIPQ